MKKKKECGIEITRPQLTPVSCPCCGFILGRGAFLNTSDPCFDESWRSGDYVVVEGVRTDRNGALVPKDFENTLCQKCAKNKREIITPWPEDQERRRKLEP